MMKKTLIALIATIALTCLYFGVQQYMKINSDHNNVEIQFYRGGSSCQSNSNCYSDMCQDGLCKECLKKNSHCTNHKNCCSQSCHLEKCK